MHGSRVIRFHGVSSAQAYCSHIDSAADASCVLDHLNGHLSENLQVGSLSVFSLRTEEASAKQYFQFYGYLSQQQNMMQV